MPLRSTATARQERLGAELRKMREAAGITARDTARLLGTDPAKVSHIEAGRLGVSEERLRRLASFYECGDTELIDALVVMANGLGRKGWWEAYRGVVPAALLDIAELEFHATALRTIQITHIPGVFQTEDYTRTVFGYAIPPLPQGELEARSRSAWSAPTSSTANRPRPTTRSSTRRRCGCGSAAARSPAPSSNTSWS